MSLNENITGIKFYELERMIYDMALGLGRHVLEEMQRRSTGLTLQHG